MIPPEKINDFKSGAGLAWFIKTHFKLLKIQAETARIIISTMLNLS